MFNKTQIKIIKNIRYWKKRIKKTKWQDDSGFNFAKEALLFWRTEFKETNKRRKYE